MKTPPCHLCGLPIPTFLVNGNHALNVSIDHVIPKSLGGLGLESNKLLAHRVCNAHRGNRDISEALRKECYSKALQAFSRLSYIPHSRAWKTVRQSIQAKRLGKPWHVLEVE